MASKASTYRRGEMDIHEQVATFDLVMRMTKWGSLALGALLLFLTLWFCTATGFMGALTTAAVAAALGVFFMRDKDDGH
jgi:hypothetical protein